MQQRLAERISFAAPQYVVLKFVGAGDFGDGDGVFAVKIAASLLLGCAVTRMFGPIVVAFPISEFYNGAAFAVGILEGFEGNEAGHYAREGEHFLCDGWIIERIGTQARTKNGNNHGGSKVDFSVISRIAVGLYAGCLLYLVGTVGVTIAFNVPLNDALAKVQPESAENPLCKYLQGYSKPVMKLIWS